MEPIRILHLWDLHLDPRTAWDAGRVRRGPFEAIRDVEEHDSVPIVQGTQTHGQEEVSKNSE